MLKYLEHAVEETNKVEELETEIIIESSKRKFCAIEKEKMIKINELKENLRIEIVKRRTKEEPLSFKIKNKEIGRKKNRIRKRKPEMIIKTWESKLDILREIWKKKFRQLNTDRIFHYIYCMIFFSHAQKMNSIITAVNRDNSNIIKIHSFLH